MDIKELNISNNSAKKNHPWEYARSKVVFDIIKKRRNKNSSGLAMDIGCGDIFFLTQFSSLYPKFNLIGIDTAFTKDMTATLLKKRANNNLSLYDDVKNVNIDQKTSVVFLMDVLEHIDDDVSFLKEVSQQKFIDQDTLFVITVPAFNSLYCKHDEWLGHYRRYSRKMLKQSIIKAELEYMTGGYFFFTLLFPRLIQKLIEKIKISDSNQQQGIGDWNGGKFTAFLYEKTLLLDYHIFKLFRVLGIKIPGLSTYVLCRKKASEKK